MKRATLIVLDSLGVGQMPDAKKFGDVNVDTLGHIVETVPDIHIEHLKDFGLINMNARLYDPVLGRFLSPDPYVQAPDLPANFNRYAYGLNNPLKYTDISGEIVTWNIGSKGFSAGINFTPFGIPLGFGISISWADGLFMGLYGEIGYRIGGGGIGAGAAINYTYGFNYDCRTRRRWTRTYSKNYR